MKNNKSSHLISASLFLLVLLTIILLTSCSAHEAYEEISFDLEDDFSIILIDVDAEDIIFLPSDDEKCRVVCYAVEGLEHTVRVDGGKLMVGSEDTRSWVERVFSLGKSNNKITVYLPTSINTSVLINSDTGDIELPGDFTFDKIDIILDTGDVICDASAEDFIKIKSSTGDIKIKGSKANSLTMESETGSITVTDGEYDDYLAKNDTGDIVVSNVECANSFNTIIETGETVLSDIVCHSFNITGDTGNITLSSVVTEGKMTIAINTGDVIFNRCDASEVKITANTGDVKGSFLTDKIVFADTDTGRTDYPKLTTGGRCDITTETGDIKITIGE